MSKKRKKVASKRVAKKMKRKKVARHIGVRPPPRPKR
jgi:hypothetical protein